MGKRAREEEGDGEMGDDVAAEEALEEEDVLPLVEEPAAERIKDKKDKKDKKKKEKKDKKAKKRRKEEAESDSGEGGVSPQIAPRTEEDIAMEEDLFGPDDE